MDDMNRDYIDTDYKEVDSLSKKQESGLETSSLYLNCKQVSQIIGESESTIRYWVKQFDDLLNITTSNSIKKYTKTDVDNLLFIKKLIREDGMTIKQTYDYCNTKGFNNTKDIIDSSNPLAIKAVIKAIMTEFNDTIKTEIIKEMKTAMVENNDNLKEELSLTVDEVINDKIEELSKENQELKDKLDCITNNLSSIQEENDKIHELQQRLVEKKEEYESKNKGFFGKLFGR
ncbi:MAG: MerR family transcriptional regulator [Terrisporobacter sp.]|uniref:MerR family transcriptional regulator n=1 Tax=Terrisporobacter sp. TaxID=1965305 RepID=UPI002A9101D6|nr:MerR family transcriptional regulator [Terrisporobacter sp.]MDY6153120.1 MerR family transcriptional regulator [Terrisporobacter sp.]